MATAIRRAAAKEADQQHRAQSSPFTALVSAITPPPRLHRVRPGVRCAIWTRPDLFTVDWQDRLYTIMAELSPRIFGVDFTSYWEVRRRDGLFGRLARFYLFADEAGEVVGWAGYQRKTFHGRGCLYFDIAAILPQFHGAGVITDVESRTVLRELLMHPWGPTYLVARTRNPRVYRSFQTAVGRDHLFPAIGRRAPEKVRMIALATAASMGQEQKLVENEQRLVETYLPHLPKHFDKTPTSGDRNLDAWFAGALGPADAFLIVGEASLWRLGAYQLRKQLRRMWRP